MNLGVTFSLSNFAESTVTTFSRGIGAITLPKRTAWLYGLPAKPLQAAAVRQAFDTTCVIVADPIRDLKTRQRYCACYEAMDDRPDPLCHDSSPLGLLTPLFSSPFLTIT